MEVIELIGILCFMFCSPPKNDPSEELKTADIIAGKSNEMDKNEDEIHQDKPGHAHPEEDTV